MEYIRVVLEKHFDGKTAASKVLGVSLKTFKNYLRT
jgi:hypothetical protein